MDISKTGKSQNPPIKDIGIPNDTHPANLGFRKRARIMTTSINPKYAFSVNNSILPLRITDSSFIAVSETTGGISGFLFFR